MRVKFTAKDGAKASVLISSKNLEAMKSKYKDLEVVA